MKLINGDCVIEMKKIASDSIDLTITSPPYNLGNNHHTGNKRHNPYDDDMPEDLYQIWQMEVLSEIWRITKKAGSIFYNHKNRIKNGVSVTPYQWLLKTPWIIKQELVWFNRSQNFDKIRFYPMTERVYWLVKDSSTKLTNIINHHDLFEWKAVGTQGKHTRAFPERMVSDILSCFPEAQVILDPFMGSGTVCKVAKTFKKDFIGIELNPDYFKLAEDRLRQESLI